MVTLADLQDAGQRYREAVAEYERVNAEVNEWCGDRAIGVVYQLPEYHRRMDGLYAAENRKMNAEWDLERLVKEWALAH
jgi:hypothetical protein